MGDLSLRAIASRGFYVARDNTPVLALFAGTLFLSATLLFSVQPVFAKMVLPKLGGAPSVWAVSMVFFQTVLLAGYGYAHALNRWCPARQAPLVQIGVMVLAALALPFGLPAFGAEPPAGDAYFWLIGVLAVGVGLPFFAVSANAPLLQSWFARSGHPQATDPYFLYGASNLGSLMTLLAYPVIVEPLIGLGRQAQVWTAGFVALGLLIGFCGLRVMPVVGGRGAGAGLDAPSDTGPVTGPVAGSVAGLATGPIATSRKLMWIWLAAIPSGLLVAFTSYVTTDVASAPFLWVIPLAVFLATFILVFREQPLVPHLWMVWSQPVLVGMTLLGLATTGSAGWVLGAVAGFAAFFVTTMVCHKELYDLRPDRSHLTAFYMWMSFGGVIGGMFAALAAPQLFNAIYEFPLLLLAGVAVRTGTAAAWNDAIKRPRALIFAAILVVGVLLIGHFSGPGFLNLAQATMVAKVVLIIGSIYLTLLKQWPLRQAAMALAMAVAVLVLPSAMNFGFAERSFFGVHRVYMLENDTMRVLLHGTTLHGAMRVKDDRGAAVTSPLPATYYAPGGPMARGVDTARRATGKADGGLIVGSVGVGSGAMACHSRTTEAWRFYEIDPVVVKLARDPKLFTYFARCRPDARFVMGDARLTLAKEAAGTFDYLVIDAFASDSIPVHLLTREAVALYLDRLAPNGLLALHISNQHMDLIEVASTLARSLPGISAVIVRDRPNANSLDATASDVMFLAKSPDVLADVRTWAGATPVIAAPTPGTPWTDDYSNVLGAILRQRGF